MENVQPKLMSVDEIYRKNKDSSFFGKTGKMTFDEIVNGYPESLSKFKFDDDGETIEYWVQRFKQGHKTVINSGLGLYQLWDGNHRIIAAKIARIKHIHVIVSNESICGFEPDDYMV